LLKEWRKIHAALACEISNLASLFPEEPQGVSRAELKSHEDMLDAIVCAWVGAQFVAGTAQAFGDENAAIWVPIVEHMPLSGPD
jgi:predicted RNase H-like nuclease